MSLDCSSNLPYQSHKHLYEVRVCVCVAEMGGGNTHTDTGKHANQSHQQLVMK